MPDDIDKTLEARGDRYGEFDSHARITYAIKDAIYHCTGAEQLPPYMKEALDMIAHKIGRILNGDPYYADSWHDIAGYARLVEDRLNTLTKEENKDDEKFHTITAGILTIDDWCFTSDSDEQTGSLE